MEVIKVANEAEVIKKLAFSIERISSEALSRTGVFRVGLSGGSLVKYLCTGLPSIKTDWSKWRLFFCDERYVPEESEDSTFGVYKRNLIPQTPLKEEQFAVINGSLSLDDCAKDYEERILTEFGAEPGIAPQFDLLLLGMGPDGHTCSLFPHHQLLKETKRLVAPISDSPKPPPERVTMTLPLINTAKNCIFAMSGTGKAEMVKRIVADKEALPAGLVKPINSKTVWIMDEAAGSLL